MPRALRFAWLEKASSRTGVDSSGVLGSLGGEGRRTMKRSGRGCAGWAVLHVTLMAGEGGGRAALHGRGRVAIEWSGCLAVGIGSGICGLGGVEVVV